MLRFSVGVLFAVLLSCPGLAERDPIRLTHGPMLGRLSDTSVAVWGRTSDPGEFRVRYGLAKDRLDRESGPAVTRIEDDNTGVAVIKGLAPDTRYHYQIWVNGRPHGWPGSFETRPNEEIMRDAEYNPRGLFNFRFEIGSCANQNPLHGIGHRSPTYEHLNRDWSSKVDFHIMNGDWLYEDRREYPASDWLHQVGLDAMDDAPRIVLAFHRHEPAENLAVVG